MAKSPKRLGRGLSDLLQDINDNSASEAPVKPDSSLAIDVLVPSKFQPRRDFSEESLDDLASSIKASGIIQPLLVRPVANGGAAPDKYEIIAGERRWRAAQRARLETIPVLIRDLTDSECMEAALVENMQREDLNPIEEATALKRLSQEFAYSNQALADRIGKSRPHISNTMRLLDLPDSVQALVADKSLTSGHARALIGKDNAHDLALHIIEKDMSVRQAEALAKKGLATARAEKPTLDPNLEDVRNQLEAHLGIRVDLAGNGSRGKLTLHFKNSDQFDGLYRLLKTN